MPRQPTVVEKRLDHSSQAIYDPNSWVSEGDGLLASARLIRSRWLHLKREIRSRKSGPRGSEWHVLTGHPNASVLLLGYAIEMFLKGGLAKWLRHCPEYLLLGDARAYGHEYRRLADDLQVEETVAPRALLDFLSKAVTLEARYPATLEAGETSVQAINRRASNMWSYTKFKEMCRMARRLRDHIQLMNGDERNPSSSRTFMISPTGYVVFRVGGHLPWRVTVRPPAGQAWDENKISALLQSIDSIEVGLCWRHCAIYLDNGKRSALIKAAQ